MNEAYLWEFLDTQDDITIVDSFVKANSVINSPLYETILCSFRGSTFERMGSVRKGGFIKI